LEIETDRIKRARNVASDAQAEKDGEELSKITDRAEHCLQEAADIAFRSVTLRPARNVWCSKDCCSSKALEKGLGIDQKTSRGYRLRRLTYDRHDVPQICIPKDLGAGNT
jgi:hypothetical protein